MKKRSQISSNYKWDIDCLCKDEKTFEQQLNKISKIIPEFKKFEGKLDNKDTIWEYLSFSEKFDKIFEPIILYIYLKRDEQLDNEKSNFLYQKVQNLNQKLSMIVSPLSNQIHKLPDQLIDSIITDKKFKDYKRMFESIKKDKPHILSDDQENLLSGMNFFGYSSVMRNLSDVDFKFDDIADSKGKKHKFDQSQYGVYVRSKDRELRKNAFACLNGKYGQYINTFASNYINKVKFDCYFAKIRKYSSALNEALFDEEIDRKVYDTLIDKVHKNLPVLFRYFNLKKKILNIKDFYIYDHMAALPQAKSKKYTYNEAIDLLKKALSPLGEEYVSLLQKAKDERWIDVMPNENKRSGAYENAIYDYHPFVLCNFVEDIDSIFTLAHELGHAMHSYFSNKAQSRPLSAYTIFLAEIASTTNEMLLLNYLLKNAKGSERFSLYNKLFEDVKSTIFRQTMFAEFEADIHKMHEEDKPLTKDVLCNHYFDLNKKYFGKVKLIKEIAFEWARIPHFFTEFYVYKYATGLICAINFAQRILNNEKGALEDYYRFLSAGCSDTPTNILKKSNCDLESGEAYNVAFKYLENMMKTWEKESEEYKI